MSAFFRRTKSLVGLDIGSSAVKAVELRQTGSVYKVAAIGSEPVPPASIVDGAIVDGAAVADVIRQLFEKNNFKSTEVVGSLSGNAVIVKKIVLPRMTEEELAEAIYWEAEQYIPFDIQDVNLHYQVLETGSGDADNRRTSASRSVTVDAGPTPEAAFVFSPDKPTTATTVQFNAIQSTAPPGRTITGYFWNFGDGSPSCTPATLHPVCQTGVTVSHSFSVAGIYNVTLTVTDSSGATDTTSDAVTVGVVSHDPTASFTFSPSKTTTGVVITFNGSASSAVGSRTIVSYEWDFGDATSPPGFPIWL